MSDTCSLSIRLRKRDLKKMEKAFGSPENLRDCLDLIEIDTRPGIMRGDTELSNYACYDQLHYAARLGVIFEGSHTSGDDYNDGVFCAINKELHDVPTLMNSDCPVVEVFPNGTLNQPSLDAALAYYAALKKVEEAFEAETSKTLKKGLKHERKQSESSAPRATAQKQRRA